MRLNVGHQQSQFWPILARSVDYYSLFWGPRAISMINEPRGAFTCQTSTLAVFDDSGPFHGLLLTFCSHEGISIVVEPQGALTCWSSTLIVLANSGPFRTVLGSRSDFHN